MTAPFIGWAFYNRNIPFVGRAKELHFLRETMRTAIEKRSSLTLLMAGAQGSGKTRLLSEFCETLDQHVDAVTIIHTACSEDPEPAYAVIQRLLRQRVYSDPDDSPQVARAKLQEGLSQILKSPQKGEEAAHVIGALVGLPFEDSPYLPQICDDESQSIEARAKEWLVEVMRQDAERAPILCVIDHLQLASPEVLQLICFLENALQDCPILMIGAYTGSKASRIAAFKPLRALKRAKLIELQPLSDAETARLTQAILTPAQGEIAPVLKAVTANAFGNPLSVEQILQLYIERGAIDPSKDPWILDPKLISASPIASDLQTQIESRLSRLKENERQILERAAVLGEQFDCQGLEMLRRFEEGVRNPEEYFEWDPQMAQEACLRILENLKHRQILQQKSVSDLKQGCYCFRHQVERQVLSQQIAPARKRSLHMRAALWLKDKADPARLAQHWDLAHCPEQAGLCYQQAGDEAAKQRALPEALAFYQNALARLPEATAPRTRLELFHNQGKIHRILGDLNSAISCFEQMLRLAWILNDRIQGGVALNKLGQIHRTRGEFDLALTQFKRALTLFKAVGDKRGLAACYDDMGRTDLMRGELDSAEERITEGLKLRQALGDKRSEAVSLHHLGILFSSQGNLKSALDTQNKALQIARAQNDERTVTDILQSLGAIAYQKGETEQSVALWEEALQLSRITSERRMQGVLLNNLAEALIALHRADEAERHLAEACNILKDVGDKRALADALRNRSNVHLSRGTYAKALEDAQSALAVAQSADARIQIAQAQCTLGQIYSATLYGELPDRPDRMKKAQTAFQSALELFKSLGLPAEWARAALAEAAFLAEQGRLSEAKTSLEQVQKLCERLSLLDLQKRAERILNAL